MKRPLIILALAASISAAHAQTVNNPTPNAGSYGAYNASPPTCTSGRGCWLQTDANGKLLVSSSSSGSIGTVNPTTPASWGLGATGAAVPANAQYIGINTGGNLVGWTGALAAGSAIIGKVGIDQTTPGTTNGVQVNAALPAGTNNIGKVTPNDGTNSILYDPCQTTAKSYVVVNLSASGSAKIITGTSAKKTYICAAHIVTNAANNVALTEGTGSNCGTNTFGIVGGTTAATGWNFSANGGIALGNGTSVVLGPPDADSNATAADICLNPSASTQLSGQVAYVQK